MTGRDLVSASLRLIGALASGETLDASQATDGLAAINRMIDSWSTENLLIYAVTREISLTLVAGKSTYTLGTGGDLTTRPVEIEAAVIQDSATGFEHPLKVRSASEYAGIGLKTTQSNYPTDIFDDGGYPLRTLTLYPTPSAGNKLNLYTLRPITTIASLNTTLSLPPGYERALVFNGAIELATEYGQPSSPEVAQIASESKASIKRQNYRQAYLRVEDLPTSLGGRFNVYKGDYN